MTGENRGKFTRRKAAIAALLSSPSVQEAAVLAGVAENTLHRWLRQPDFMGELRAAEDAAIGAAVRRLAGLSGDAADVLGNLLTDPEASPAARLRAALGILETLVKLRDRDISERLTALERVTYGDQ